MRSVLVALTLAVAATLVVAGCGAGTGATMRPLETASLLPAASGSPGAGRSPAAGVSPAVGVSPVAPAVSPAAPAVSPAAPASPVTGLLVKIDSRGLTRVTGFRLRIADGTEIAFTIGVLENGVEFPPGHLAEHMSTSSPVRVFFHDEGGSLVVYRIEDAG